MHTPPSSPLQTGMRLCAVLMAGLGLYLLLSGTVSWWRALLAIVLLACPVTILWVSWRYGRRDSQAFEDRDITEARHE